MNCRETERLLDTFFDGELEGRLMREAALHVTRCPSCERELRQRERLQEVVSTAVASEVAEFDLDSLWAGVQRGLAEGGQVRDTPRLPISIPGAARRRASGWRDGRRSSSRSGSQALPAGRPATALRRRTIRRVSAAAGFGAVAVGLAAVLLFPSESEVQRSATASRGVVEEAPLGRSGRAAVAAAASPAGATGEPGSTVRVATSRAAPGRASTSTTESAVEPVALGPVETADLLGPAWAQQVRVGPLELDDHALSWWRQSGGR